MTELPVGAIHFVSLPRVPLPTTGVVPAAIGVRLSVLEPDEIVVRELSADAVLRPAVIGDSFSPRMRASDGAGSLWGVFAAAVGV